MSDQNHHFENAYACIRSLREGVPSPTTDVRAALDALDASVAQLHQANDELNEKILELAVRHEKYRELFELAPDAFLVTNEHGIIMEANASAAALIHKEISYLVGKPLIIFVAESDKRDFLGRLGQLADSKETTSWELEIAARNGEYRTVTCRVVAAPARRSTPAALYWLIHDITERVQMERKLNELNSDLERRVEERTEQLAGAHADLQYLSGKLVSVQEEERKRISRELHDEAGQGLIALRMNLEALREDVPPEQAELQSRLLEAGELAFRTVERLRILAQDLRPPAIDMADLDAILSQLCYEMARRSKIEVHYAGTALPPLDSAVKISLYRFLQEALNNVAEHSEATEADVCLEHGERDVCLSVADNGVGFDASHVFASKVHSGIGLLGMKERIEMLGGTIEVESTIDQGTRVGARVPIALGMKDEA